VRLDHITPKGLLPEFQKKIDLIKPICRCFNENKKKKANRKTSFLGSHSLCEPPDPIPNSEVKPQRADDSVRPPHAKVGYRQGFKHISPS
jgi:hypothetical protein